MKNTTCMLHTLGSSKFHFPDHIFAINMHPCKLYYAWELVFSDFPFTTDSSRVVNCIGKNVHRLLVIFLREARSE